MNARVVLSAAFARSAILTRSIILTFSIILSSSGTAWANLPQTKEVCQSEGNLLSAAAPAQIAAIFNAEKLTDGIGEAEGGAWDSSTTSIFETAQAQAMWQLPSPLSNLTFVIQADNNDTYSLDGSLDGETWVHLWRAVPVQGAGLRTRSGRSGDSPIRYLRLTASGGDLIYSVSELVVTCASRTGAQAPFVVLPSAPYLPREEYRTFGGAIEWLIPFAVFFICASTIVIYRGLRTRARHVLGLAQSARTFLKHRYCEYDIRSLALFRVVFGVLLLYDLTQRWRLSHYFYSPSGLVTPNEALAGTFPWHSLTLFRYVESDSAVQAVFLLSGLVYCCFLLGYKTKFAQCASLVCAVSLHNANPMVGHSGHMVMRLSLLWTLFLPLGAYLSVDARMGRAVGAKALHLKAVSWAFTVILVQLSVIYFFNTLSKFATPWRDGTIIYLALHDEVLATPVGIWVRDSFPRVILQLLSWGTLIVEGAAPFLLLSPWRTAACRVVAILSLVPLHLGILILMPLSIFSVAMISLLLVVLPASASGRVLRGAKWGGDHLALAQTEGRDEELRYGRWRQCATALIPLYLVLGHVSQLVRENQPLGRYLPHHPIPFLQFSLEALRTYQGWCMFASCGDTSHYPVSSMIVVSGLDSDGSPVDVISSAFLRHRVLVPSDYRARLPHVYHELFHTYLRNLTSGHPGLLVGLRRWLHAAPLNELGVTLSPPIEVFEQWKPLSTQLLQYERPLIQKRPVWWARHMPP